MFEFLDPWFFLLALVVPLWLWGRRTFLKPASFGFSDSQAASAISKKARARFLFLPVLLQIIGLVLLVAALARPVMKEHDAILYTEGVDIMLCVDTSSSMSENALSSDRTNLDVARDVLKHFVASRENDRLGLIAFARFPELHCPLTTDHEAMSRFLDQLKTVKQGSEKDGTAVGAALAEAARRWVSLEQGAAADPEKGSVENATSNPGVRQEAADTPSRERIIVLLTDGDENQYVIDPMMAANLCADFGIRVYPVAAASLIGNEVRAFSKQPMSERILEDVARITEGVFSRARTEDDLKRTYQEIDALEKRPIEYRNITRDKDLYPWFLAPSMVLLLLAFALESTVLLRIP